VKKQACSTQKGEASSRELFAAVRTEAKRRLKQSTALGTAVFWLGLGSVPCFFSGLAKKPSTALALNKRFAFFHPQNRDEEEREIVIDPLRTSLIEPAKRTHSRTVIEFDGLWLNSGYEEEQAGPLLLKTC